MRKVERTRGLDARRIDELTALFAGEWWTRGRERADVERAVEGSSGFVALTDRESGELVGFARYLTDGVYKALVLDVVVAPGRRGAGLGRRLLEELARDLAGVRHVELYCLPEMEPVYARFGFARTDPLLLLRAEAIQAPPSTAPD